MKLAFFLTTEDGVYTRFNERHIQRAYRTEELTTALEQAGFQIEGVYEWPGKQEPNPNSERIQIVAQKAKTDNK